MAELDDLSSEDFLDIVWGEQKGWIDLPAKVAGYWVPWHYRWTGEAGNDITRRIDTCLRDEESLYFSVGLFTKRGRDYDDLKPPQWLWADLDETHPSAAATHGILPTLAWESSPGRFQALWRLNTRVRPETFDKLNQALSYFLGADHGGWDRTQVLRIPGTRNYKYPSAPEVKLLWYHPELTYNAKYIWTIVRASLPADGRTAQQSVPSGPRRAMPGRVRALLRVPADAVVEGERSSKLWAIECMLAEAGWGEDEIHDVVAGSAWNKWSAVGTGERRLRLEIRKAIAYVARKKAKAGRREESRVLDRRSDASATRGRGDKEADLVEDDLGGRSAGDDAGDDGDGDIGEVYEEGSEDDARAISLPFVRYGSFMAMAMEEPKWLIENLWTAGSHGILGGEPKTSKTTLALAMGMSVASGKAWLGNSDYAVRTPGPVLMVNEETAPWVVQDRMRKLASLYGLIPPQEVRERRAQRGSLSRKVVDIEFPSDIPIRLLNRFGLDLTEEEHRDALFAECEVVKPKLIILDPFYLLFAGVNFDKAHDLAPYLKWLLSLAEEFQCAVMVVHHFRKQQFGNMNVRPGQRMMGNATLHGFVDAALYAEQMEAPDRREKKRFWTRVEREYRSIEPQKALEVGLRMSRPGLLDMEVEISKYDLQRAIENLVFEQPGITVNQIAEQLGIDKRTALGRCRDSSTVVVTSVGKGRGRSNTVNPVTKST